MTLSEKIYRLRTEHSMSQEQLADRLEVSRQSVSKWETGTSVPDLDKLIKICDIFSVSLDEITGRTAKNVEKNNPESSAAPASDDVTVMINDVEMSSEVHQIESAETETARYERRTQHTVGIVLLIFSLALVLIPVILLIPQASDDVSYSYVNTVSLVNFILLYFLLPVCLTWSIICLSAKRAAFVKCIIASFIMIAFLIAFLPIFRELAGPLLD